MVTIVSDARADSTVMARPSLVVELVGPAGSGKTTLFRALSQRNQRVVKGARPRVRRIGHIPFFARNTISLLPTLLRLHQNGRWFTRQEVGMLARLNGWHYVLTRQASRSERIIVVDQGPVFLLSWLAEFGPESLKGQSSQDWWDSMVKQWAAVLDVVICLDAPDSVLTERINRRGKRHTVKGRPEQEMRAFLARGRTSVDETISRLTASGGPTVLVFDTALESPGKIAEKVLASLGLAPSDE